MTRVLILGVSGMLGSAVFNVIANDSSLNVKGTARSRAIKRYFPAQMQNKIIDGIDVLNNDSLVSVIGQVKPNVVINCVGLIKQLSNADDPLVVLPVNSILPHRLSAICEISGTRLIHISTDCVFDGAKGGYVESDISNALDIYGKSKFIGEIHADKHAITLRTSIIGHELSSRHALIEWFLAQTGSINGYTRAIFSGLPTAELARVVKDFVIPRTDLCGLYHVSADPISKFDLLSLVSEIYGKEIEIIPTDKPNIDRSLNSKRFQQETGYKAAEWSELVSMMKQSKIAVRN
jgi:dTDP-4-dehydrorhamnose reductase